MQSEELSEELTGIVTAFNDAHGLGEITDTSSVVWPFHCVSIADGSRTIEVGRTVVFRAGFRVARPEAVSIRLA
jgi:cold shock CspA family protein